MSSCSSEGTPTAAAAGVMRLPLWSGSLDEEYPLHDVLDAVALNCTLVDVPHLVRVMDVVEERSPILGRPLDTRTSGAEDAGESSPSSLTAPHLAVVEEEVCGISLERLDALIHHSGFRPLRTTELRVIARDVLHSLVHLHERARVIHAHVRLSAILLDTSTERARLRGSAFAKEAAHGYTFQRSAVLEYAVRAAKSTSSDSLWDVLWWCAPEVLAAGTVDLHTRGIRGFSFASDLYSLGATLVHVAGAGEETQGRGGTTADRVRASVLALHCSIAGECGEAHVAALRAAHGNDFLAFLSCCVEQDAARRPSARELLNHPFLRDGAECPGEVPERESTLGLLLRDVENFLGGVGERLVANTRAYWTLPPPDTVTDAAVDPPHTGEVQQKLPSMSLHIPPELLSAISARADGHVPGAVGHGQGAVVESTTSCTSSLDPIDSAAAAARAESVRRACEAALLSALQATKAILQQQQLVEEPERTGRPAHAPALGGTPSPSHVPLLSSHAYGWRTPRRTHSLPASSPRQGSGAFRGSTAVGVAQGIPPPRPASARLAESASLAGGQERIARTGRVEPSGGAADDSGETASAERLMDVMATELRALVGLAPDFAMGFCEAFAAGATASVEELAACVDSVDELVPRLTDAEQARAADACAAPSRRGARRLDLRKPLHTADQWAQVPAMARGTPTTSAGESPIPAAGGGAAALLYNKWLRGHQRGVR